MSGWVSPTHPAQSPIPLGALRGGDGVGRWVGRNGRPPPHRVDGPLWRRRPQGSHGRAADGWTTLMLERSGSSVSSGVSVYPA